VIECLHDPAYDRSLGLVSRQLLGNSSPARVAWSLVLYERGFDRNYVRVHADSLDEPFDINSGAKLQLVSTAELRTLVTYLDMVEELHRRLAPLSRAELVAAATAKADDDVLANWAADYLANTRDRDLKPMIAAAMQRLYSGSSRGFFTGGSVHAYAVFEKWENHAEMSVADGFARSINNVFICIMRDPSATTSRRAAKKRRCRQRATTRSAMPCCGALSTRKARYICGGFIERITASCRTRRSRPMPTEPGPSQSV
jgi:hypothetical protein